MCFPSLEPPKIMVKKYKASERLTTKGQASVAHQQMGDFNKFWGD